MYIYPENLKARATLWFWGLGDLAALGSLLAVSLFFLSVLQLPYPLMVSVLFAILTIRVEEYSIMDFMHAAIRFFFSQQLYFWEVEEA